MEQNKVRSYFLYAIGEVALVMIGILLALQVNNWNEERKGGVLADQYLNSLRADLSEDIEMLKESYEYAFADSVQIANQISRIKESQLHPDSLKNIILFEFNYLVRSPRPFNRKTYSTLISTGDISLLSNEINQKLVQLIKEQDVRTYLIEVPNEAYMPVYISFNKSYPVKDLPFSEDLLPVLYDKIDAIQLLNDFNQIAGLKAINPQRLMLRKRQLEQQSRDLIELIDQTLE